MIKKLILLIAIILQSYAINAQIHGQNTPQNMVLSKFNAQNAAGILYYKEDAVIKKLKISDKNTIASVNKAISEYNNSIDKIKFLNSDKLKEIEKSVNTQQKIARAANDREAMMAIKDQIRKRIKPIKKQVNIATNTLNQQLKELLNEKQYKKWLRYQAAKKAKLKPKQQMGPGNQGGMGRGNGNHRGSGMHNGRGGF